MLIRIAETVRNSRLAIIRDALDAGATPGTIDIYTGPQPGSAGGAITTQVLLGTHTLSQPCGSINAGVLAFDPIADDDAADNSGEIAWARFYDGDGNVVMDGDCGLSGSGAMIIYDTLTAYQGGTLKILSAVLVEGNL